MHAISLIGSQKYACYVLEIPPIASRDSQSTEYPFPTEYLEDGFLLQNMAEAIAIALPSGYDDEFVNSLDEDLYCSICHLPLKEAVQTGKCGHRFCKQCLDEHFRRLVVLLIV